MIAAPGRTRDGGNDSPASARSFRLATGSRDASRRPPTTAPALLRACALDAYAADDGRRTPRERHRPASASPHNFMCRKRSEHLF